ncbi:protein kinase domain-containing protein [Streptomyces viridosporus]|uniref:non-specific serine/threonine protein kinase n=3 Tax=Actinomycetes TaxID=1760 RepID=A0ABX6AG43_STRVD|nr:protein kinase [Streptomyces viridosporus]EFE68306.1 serine/threonine protein kinase [Streptomyces viridosporus ATCC 14672]QEU86748.1 serine/threonine protein kinase [Streptomyces viridosporus T7A]
MAQQQRAQGPSDPEATGGGMSDAPETWGNGGLVGDGRYRLTHRLGRGGMAEVFAAEDVRLGRTVAVKLLRSDLAEDPTSKARFTREAQSVAGLNHHAIVAVYDSGEDTVGGQAVPYIVMELVEGRTIRDLLMNAEAPGPEQALIIVSGVLEALAYSHQHNIVHRDIKPANVIITNNGAVKVMDFGIARAMHGASTTMTQTGMVMGTPQYLSPEQALGKAVDHRSDLYATGCMLYELLALRPPFTGETPLSVVYQHVQDIPTPPSEVSDACPPELDGMVMRSLAKDPDDRFQTAEEMRGLVQYALQMLYEQGGHTGTWNTGPVEAHEGRHTPAAGFAGTTVMPHPDVSGTAAIPQPILPAGYGSGDDGGFEGHGNQGSGRGKLWILAVLAVIAVTAGVALALNTGGGGGDKKEPATSPSVSQSTEDDPASESPSDEETEEPTGQNPGTGTGNGNGSGGNWDRSYTPSQTPSQPQTEEPSNTPPPTQPTETGGTDTGGTDAGGTDTGGTDTGGTNPGGANNGGANNGGADAGGADVGGAAGEPGVTGAVGG